MTIRPSPDTIRVTIQRTDPAAPGVFDVPRLRPMMVLDALLAVQRDHDPALGFRFSCRVAMCGTCTVRVDGRSALACQTPLAPDVESVHIGPVAGLPVIRDLIVDTAPFWAEWARVTPFTPADDHAEPAVIPPDSPERRLIGPAMDCIACGACYSSCGVAAAGRDFLGPAALQRAMVLVADSRDGAGDERLRAIAESGSLDRCHYMYGCTGACPKGLDPAKAIRQLRRWRNHGAA
ncbi:MAG TPA: 2Fe-2S iron-sulfur cluster-binding protein [Streptosporangiaceae bacterium]|nr:2Fe-2S iron-sulfur cluster-binding protein [Streptosporangiaceae bacterium]